MLCPNRQGSLAALRRQEHANMQGQKCFAFSGGLSYCESGSGNRRANLGGVHPVRLMRDL
jgi:hypothetical protein